MPTIAEPVRDGKPHHCPLQGGDQGNCRMSRKYAYCTRHQNVCLIHHLYFLITEGCHACYTDYQKKRQREKDDDEDDDEIEDYAKKYLKIAKDKSNTKRSENNKKASGDGTNTQNRGGVKVNKAWRNEGEGNLNKDITRMMDELFAAGFSNQLADDTPSPMDTSS